MLACQGLALLLGRVAKMHQRFPRMRVGFGQRLLLDLLFTHLCKQFLHFGLQRRRKLLLVPQLRPRGLHLRLGVIPFKG